MPTRGARRTSRGRFRPTQAESGTGGSIDVGRQERRVWFTPHHPPRSGLQGPQRPRVKDRTTDFHKGLANEAVPRYPYGRYKR